MKKEHTVRSNQNVKQKFLSDDHKGLTRAVFISVVPLDPEAQIKCAKIT